MTRPKLKSNYKYIHDDALPGFGHGVAQQITVTTYFNKGAERAKPIEEGAKALDTALAESAHPTPSQTAAREALRGALRSAMGDAATQFNLDVKALNLDIPQQTAALLSTGLTLAEQGGGSRVAPTGIPTDVVLAASKQAHCIEVSYKRPKGAVQTITRYTTDPTLPEDNWQVKTGGARKQTLGPFRKGEEVFAKTAALWPTTEEPDYTTVFSYVAQ